MLVLEAHDEDRGDHACTRSSELGTERDARAEHLDDATRSEDHGTVGLAAIRFVVQGARGPVDGPGDTFGVTPPRQDALTHAPTEVRQ
jgi:hypothetical protein